MRCVLFMELQKLCARPLKKIIFIGFSLHKKEYVEKLKKNLLQSVVLARHLQYIKASKGKTKSSLGK